MNYYKAIIQYDGTDFAGFQWQNELRTVQAEFNSAVEKIVAGKFTTMAASRTDTGVHALFQVVKISTVDKIEIESFKDKINSVLPSEIKCLAIDNCEGKFKPSVAISKEYRYFFTNKKQPTEVERRFISNISNPQEMEALQICLQKLIGTHDFQNFYSSGSNVKSTKRTILKAQLSEINPHEIFVDQRLFSIPANIVHCYQLQIVANGFLKQMIRHLVSSLWMVGSGKISIDEFQDLIDGPKRQKQLWKVAPPNGLFLTKINY